MTDAIALLDELDLQYHRPTDYQIKILGSISFWPSTGRIHVDGEKRARQQIGLDALRTIIVDMKSEGMGKVLPRRG